MKVLGLCIKNGSSSIALVVGGKLISHATESLSDSPTLELPHKTIQACLKGAGLILPQLNRIAVVWILTNPSINTVSFLRWIDEWSLRSRLRTLFRDQFSLKEKSIVPPIDLVPPDRAAAAWELGKEALNRREGDNQSIRDLAIGAALSLNLSRARPLTASATTRPVRDNLRQAS